MKNKNILLVSITSVIFLILVIGGITYAYFSAQITGIESASTLTAVAGSMTITYSEGTDEFSVQNAYPREEEWVVRHFTLTARSNIDLKMKSNVSTWVTATWSANSVTNLCKINSCASGYKVSNNTCVVDSCTVYCTSASSCTTTRSSSDVLYGVFTCNSGKTGSVSQCWYGSTQCNGGSGGNTATRLCISNTSSSGVSLKSFCNSSLSTTHVVGLGLDDSDYTCSC